MQKITQVGVISFAKVSGMSGVLIGLIVGVIYGGILILMGLIGVGAGGQQGAGIAAFGIGGGLAIMIAAPIAYGVFSFVFGLIYALIINVVLKMAGGLELEIQQA